MEKLVINHFKAFDSRIAFLCHNNQNLLIYGENGSGKTSVYEAICQVFYRNRLLKPHITVGASAEVKAAEEQTYYRSFSHKQPIGTPLPEIFIEINDTDFKGFDSSGYACFMISNAYLKYENTDVVDNKAVIKDIINLKKIFSKCMLPSFDETHKIEEFLNINGNLLITNVNKVLHNDFAESFHIGFDNQNFDIFIEDTSNNIRESNGLQKVFNEAKINLVLILLFFETVKIMQATVTLVKNLLVIDDLITSLDASNRLFFCNYILNHFTGFQKIILTHNVGYNNLMVNRIGEHNDTNNWKFYNLYITNQGPQLYSYNDLRKATDIRTEFDAGRLSPVDTGVAIRKRFEADIYEIAKYFSIDATSMAMTIVSNIVGGNVRFYYYKEGNKLKNADNLVETINAIIAEAATDTEKMTKITAEIAKYHSDADIVKLQQFIKEFHYFEKMLIHSLAHGTAPMPTFIQKEVHAATHLLEHIETLTSQIKSDTMTP